MNRLPLIVVGLTVICTPFAALADAATHDLSLRLKTLAKTDCGGGSCVPACMVYGSLSTTRAGPAKTEPLQIELWFKSQNSTDMTSITLSFDGIRKNHVAKSTGHAPGHACKAVAVDKVTIACASGERCPGFYYVQIPAVSQFRLVKQKVEAK